MGDVFLGCMIIGLVASLILGEKYPKCGACMKDFIEKGGPLSKLETESYTSYEMNPGTSRMGFVTKTRIYTKDKFGRKDYHS